jgi:hypothetical protein
VKFLCEPTFLLIIIIISTAIGLMAGGSVTKIGISVRRWLQTRAQAGSSLADFSTIKMEAIHSSETSVHTRSTRRHIPEKTASFIVTAVKPSILKSI